jgi:hypothetical protein
MIFAAPLLAFFESPAMLGWLAAASAPLIIHLLNKRRFQESSWAAMQFLLAAVRKNSRRVLLEHWLLLALRTLIILLFVTAAAQPGMQTLGLTTPTAERTHRVVVVDASLSMDYRPTGKASYFEQAKALARQIIDQGRPGDAYSLVALASPSRAVTSQPLLNRDDLEALLPTLQQTHGAGDLASCLNEIDRVIAKTKEQLPQIRRREVHFLTDLGKHTWEPGDDAKRGGEALDAFQARCQRWGSETTLAVVDVGSADAENIAVIDLAADEPFGVVGLPTTIRAVVRNFGRNAKSGVTAALLLDRRKVDEKTIDLDPGAEMTIVFDAPASATPREPGARVYEIELAPDNLPADNRRSLVLQVKPHLRVLLVHEPALSPDAEFGVRNLETALRLKPGADAAESSPVQVDVAIEADLRRRDLADYDAICTVDVRRFAGETIRRLHAYVQAGGGLIVFLGPRVDAEHYNTQLAAGDLRLLPAKLGPLVDEPQYRLNPLQYAHPLLAEFRGREQGGLLNTPVYKYFRLDSAAAPQTQRVLEFLNAAKDPLLVEETIGAGRTLLLATGIEKTWTTMPLSPSFLPVVQEMLSFAVGGRASQHGLLVGEVLQGTFKRTTATATVTVDPPPSEAARGSAASPAAIPPAAEVVPQGEFYRWSLADAPLAGIYTAHISGPPAVVERYAVNGDPRESDLVKLPSVRLTDRNWSQIRFAYGTDVRDFSDSAPQFVAATGGNNWPRNLLLCAFAAALVETWWAGRIGRRRL